MSIIAHLQALLQNCLVERCHDAQLEPLFRKRAAPVSCGRGSVQIRMPIPNTSWASLGSTRALDYYRAAWA